MRVAWLLISLLAKVDGGLVGHRGTCTCGHGKQGPYCVVRGEPSCEEGYWPYCYDEPPSSFNPKSCRCKCLDEFELRTNLYEDY